MNYLTTFDYSPDAAPDVVVTIRKPSVELRQSIEKRQVEAESNYSAALVLWTEMIAAFEGFTIDGETPSLVDFFMRGDETVVSEILKKLTDTAIPPQTDEMDLKLIANMEQEIVKARQRMELRKNLGRPSFSTTLLPVVEAGPATSA